MTRPSNSRRSRPPASSSHRPLCGPHGAARRCSFQGPSRNRRGGPCFVRARTGCRVGLPGAPSPARRPCPRDVTRPVPLTSQDLPRGATGRVPGALAEPAPALNAPGQSREHRPFRRHASASSVAWTASTVSRHSVCSVGSVTGESAIKRRPAVSRSQGLPHLHSRRVGDCPPLRRSGDRRDRSCDREEGDRGDRARDRACDRAEEEAGAGR